MKRTYVPFIIFAVGIAFTIICAAKPAEIGKWPDTKLCYLIGITVCISGLIAWRRAVHSGKINSPEGSTSSSEELFRKLHECRDFAGQIRQKLSTLDSDALCEMIDELLIDYMDPFVENRHVLIDHFGMAKGSDILLKTAFAERQFNRAWSAASDHCLPEARTSFELALSSMVEIVDYVEQLD